jgi:hypothetical protein
MRWVMSRIKMSIRYTAVTWPMKLNFISRRDTEGYEIVGKMVLSSSRQT